MIDDELLASVRSGLKVIADHPVISGYDQLQRELARWSIEGPDNGIEFVAEIASNVLGSAASHDDLWNVIEALRDQAIDTEEIRLILNSSLDDYIELEAIVLERTGLSRAATISLLMEVMADPSGAPRPPDPKRARSSTAKLAEALAQREMEDEQSERSRNRRFLGKLRRIRRAVQVLGGGVLLLADVAATATVAVTAPAAILPAGAVATASIWQGNKLLHDGTRESDG